MGANDLEGKRGMCVKEGFIEGSAFEKGRFELQATPDVTG